MVASIGVISSAGQGVSYYERDGYYALGGKTMSWQELLTICKS